MERLENSTINHGIEFFYKYRTVKSLLDILTTLTIRVSAPGEFNDPFDADINLATEFDEEILRQRFLNEATRLILSEAEPSIDPDGPFKEIFDKYRKTRKGLDSEYLRRSLESELAINFLQSGARIRKDCEVLRDHLRTMRLFCVVEKWDNLLMWAHYAADHKGAVIKLRSFHGGKSLLPEAEKVIYSPIRPLVSPMDLWARQLTGQGRVDSNIL